MVAHPSVVHWIRDEHDDDEGGESVPLLSQQQIQKIKTFDNQVTFNEAMIQERDQELRHIEQSIVEVNEIFRDLGSLVNEQQYMLDNIETNVSNTETHLQGAARELSTANQYQKRYRKRMFWMTVIGVAVVLFILLYIIA